MTIGALIYFGIWALACLGLIVKVYLEMKKR